MLDEDQNDGKSTTPNALRIRNARKKPRIETCASDDAMTAAITKLVDAQTAQVQRSSSQQQPGKVDDPKTAHWIEYGKNYGKKAAALPDELQDVLRYKMEKILYKLVKKNAVKDVGNEAK